MPITTWKHEPSSTGDFAFSGKTKISKSAKRLLSPLERTAIIVALKRRVEQHGPLAHTQRFSSRKGTIVVVDNLPQNIVTQYTPTVQAEYNYYTILTEEEL